jgi:nucleoside-diphosphate-sugar epimerase
MNLPMRIFLTGARGLPALAAARQFHRAGHTVLACDTLPPALDHHL